MHKMHKNGLSNKSILYYMICLCYSSTLSPLPTSGFVASVIKQYKFSGPMNIVKSAFNKY